MIAQQVRDALEHIYATEKRRIVFWYDPEGEFAQDIDRFELQGVTLLRLDSMPALEVKARLEIEDGTGRYLLYAPYAQPDNQDNWLLDIQLYSRVFFADSVSILLDDLGLAHQTLRGYLTDRRKFLANKERVAQLKRWIQPSDGERELDLKMLAVTVKAAQPDTDSVLLTLFDQCCERGQTEGFSQGCEELSATWEYVASYGLAESFWQAVSERFSYARDGEHRNLRDLFFCLAATDLANAYREETPEALRSFVLPDRNLGRNASVFLANWRSSANHYRSYSTLSGYAASELAIENVLSDCSWRGLLDVMTFSAVEKCILANLRDLALEVAGGHNPEEVAEVSRIRKDGDWTRQLSAEDGVNHFACAYQAIDHATQLFSMRWEADGDIEFSDPKTACETYVEKLFHFDQSYRLFHERAEQIQQKGWDILKNLQEAVEGCYSGWYLPQLSGAWGQQLESRGGLLQQWTVADLQAQQDFYDRQVQSFLDSNPRSRVFVIVSDALRYESAQELHEELLAMNRFDASLEPMLSVLPSYTALGMAALLPHKQLSFRGQESGTVMADRQYTSSMEQRSKVLAAHGGVAISASDMMTMRKDEGREFIKPYRVVYVYHDEIDSTGDKRASELHVFDAVRNTINHLKNLVGFLVNSLNASLVLVTADHGFLFTAEPLVEADKSKLEEKPSTAFAATKRYILGHGLGDAQNVWSGSTSVTASMEEGADFWVPKGVGRFHFMGGARYVHGGAMPQEVLIPVIAARRARGKQEAKAQVRKVDISQLEAGQIRITNTIRRFDFIQIDPVSDKIQPRTVEIFLREGDTMLSNTAKITFDSTSDGLEERKRSAQLTISAGKYDKTGNYKLIVRDADTGVEIHSLPVIIDLAFGADF